MCGNHVQATMFIAICKKKDKNFTRLTFKRYSMSKKVL